VQKIVSTLQAQSSLILICKKIKKRGTPTLSSRMPLTPIRPKISWNKTLCSGRKILRRNHCRPNWRGLRTRIRISLATSKLKRPFSLAQRLQRKKYCLAIPIRSVVLCSAELLMKKQAIATKEPAIPLRVLFSEKILIIKVVALSWEDIHKGQKCFSVQMNPISKRAAQIILFRSLQKKSVSPSKSQRRSY